MFTDLDIFKFLTKTDIQICKGSQHIPEDPASQRVGWEMTAESSHLRQQGQGLGSSLTNTTTTSTTTISTGANCPFLSPPIKPSNYKIIQTMANPSPCSAPLTAHFPL